MVEFEPDAAPGLFELGELAEELSLLVGRRVDLVPKRGLKPLIRDEVIRSARLLFAA